MIRAHQAKINWQRLLPAQRSAAIFVLRRAIPFAMPFKDMEAYRLCTWRHGSLPRIPITEIFPGIEKVDVSMRNIYNRTVGTSVDAEEILDICAIERFIKATRILEIGTFDGNTALNLAANTPGTVTTVDLPDDWNGELKYDVPKDYINVTNPAKVGMQYRGSPEEQRITQVLADSAKLDWRNLGGQFDLIFVDGCHHYDYVKQDTENALAHLKNGGVLIWHDYGMIKDVSKVVDEVAKKIPVAIIRGTRLAVARK